ncbi:MAG: hypothetical protein EPN84_06530 [Legionella sp.]|nr:MAG: hypothetical protein EPN84_06530 [Legionella sp.]
MDPVLVTIAFLVFVGAIAVFFAQEFNNTLKSIFAIRGMLLILPLALASWLVYTFDYWVLWAIYYYRETLQVLIDGIAYLIPLKSAPTIAMILVLALVSIVPIWVADYILFKRSYTRFPYPYLASTLILVISSICLIMVN